MHADGKSTLTSVSKWNSGKVNCFMVFEYLITTKTLTTKSLFFVKFQAPFSHKIINIQLNISCIAFIC